MADRNKTMSNIADWSVAAAMERRLDYYVPFEMQSKILEGKRSFIVGRRGTGKTALCTFVESVSNSRRLPVDLYRIVDIEIDEGKNINARHDAVEAWKYIIYLSACEAILKYGINISHDSRELLRSKFNIREDVFLSDTALIKKMKVSGSIPGFQLSGEMERSVVSESFAVYIRKSIEVLVGIISEVRGEKPIFVIFDELEEQVNGKYIEWQKRKKIIGPLFKAVADIKSGPLRDKVFPLIAAREDLYYDLDENDASKWLDLTYHLRWSDLRIREMLKRRIELATDSEHNNFAEAWGAIFSDERIKDGSGKYQGYEHIKALSQMRPRDFIAYMKICAESAYDDNRDLFSLKFLKDNSKNFSNWAYQELLQEISLIVPYAPDVLNTLRKIEKPILLKAEFERMYDLQLKNFSGASPVSKVIEVLWRYGIIGSSHNNGKSVFSYEMAGEMPETANIAVHRSLLWRLAIF